MSIPHFHSLKVLEVKPETNSCVSVSFELPENLKETFKFEAGQYITIKKVIDGEELRRSYSLCSSPLESDFRVAVKEVEQGKFSGFANHKLKAGEVLEVMSPIGSFTTTVDKANVMNYMAFAAGSGITPILSLIKTILAEEPHSTFTLVYGNQNVNSIIFREEIEGLKNRYMGRLQVFHVLSRERMETDVNYGRIDKIKCEQLFSRMIDMTTINKFFLCGPEQMITSVKDYLVSNNVDESTIRFELFNSTSSQEKKESYKESHKADSGKMSRVTIKVDERSFDLDLEFTGESILDAALKHGADLPFACKGGVCCTCRAKVIEGEVEMEVNYALEKDEVANGFVLTCQSHPKSERVIIDFDAR
jgi:ring-1,2-phenylacetyl-CoA epoxidase subunit PaaE